MANWSASLDKRDKRILIKINEKYFSGIDSGKNKSYYRSFSFFRLYAKRVFYLILKFLIGDKATLENFKLFWSKRFFPFYINQSTAESNTKFKEFFKRLIGLRYAYLPDLFDALPIKEILKNKIELPTSVTPDVSIVIPIYNNLAFTYNCLLSLQKNISARIKYEVIVIDDCSSDETHTFFSKNVYGIKYIKNEQNLGFLKSCNKAIDHADGRFVCLLNNDTQIRPNWIESLIEVIITDETVGCVGSKLIYPHGVLQEAGGIVFRDASGANYGRLDAPNKECYNYRREVDYCSGASILFRKADFLSLGRFDLQFAPAYYEDTDLCMAIRNILGKKVIYQPLSEVIHFEGITSGKEVKPGSVKFNQEINRHKFKRKWNHALQEHHINEDVHHSSRRLLRNTVLIIEYQLPSYDKDSGSLRIYRIIKILQSLNYHIVFCPHNREKFNNYYWQLLHEGVEISTDFFDILDSDNPAESALIRSIAFAWIARPELNDMFGHRMKVFKNIKWIYDTVDLHFLRMQREVEIRKDITILAEVERMRETELRLAKQADLTITVTEVEAKLLNDLGIDRTATIPNIHIANSGLSKRMRERSGILFIGGYSHTPNVDAVIWLVTEIMPLVWTVDPTIHLYLLGSNPPPEVMRLESDRISVPGYIKDVSEYFDSSRIFVSPLRYGAGMKGKIGQSLEYFLPVVSTTIGVEGMALDNDKNVLVADTATEFAQQILLAYNNETVWNTLSSSSYNAIHKFSPAVITPYLDHLLLTLQQS